MPDIYETDYLCTFCKNHVPLPHSKFFTGCEELKRIIGKRENWMPVVGVGCLYFEANKEGEKIEN